jgi:hypothetical protein
VSNPLNHNYLRRGIWVVAAWALVACGSKKPEQQPKPEPTAPLPTAGLAGQRVALTPLELVGAEDTIHLDSLITSRRATLDRCDSIIMTLLAARAPEVTWVGPAELRHIARRAAGIVSDPDQMGTPFLRASNIIDVPDPLRYQLRTLMGLVGGRYVLVPAGLVLRKPLAGQPGADVPGAINAELSVVMIDSRVGKVGYRTVARGQGPDVWTALTRAVKNLTPGVP